MTRSLLSDMLRLYLAQSTLLQDSSNEANIALIYSETSEYPYG